MVSNKILVLFLLCTALPTFCMDPAFAFIASGQLCVLGRRHKDKDLLRVASIEQAEPFFCKAIACRKDHGVDDGVSPLYYGYLELTMNRRPLGPQVLRLLKLYCIKDGFYAHGISDHVLATQNWFMRLLTLDEIRCLSNAIKEKTISPDSPTNGQFTLDNLIPEEQIKYFRQQVQKNEWQRLRLLLIGQRDPESPLHLLPKDLIRSFARYTFDGQVQQLKNNAKLGDVLEL